MLPLSHLWPRHAAKAPRTHARRTRRRQLGVDALEGRQLMSLATEFLVNKESTIDNDQFQTENASGVNGETVVVWVSESNRSDFDVFAKVYDRFGNEVV